MNLGQVQPLRYEITSRLILPHTWFTLSELEISCYSGGMLSSGNPGTGAIWMKNLACEGDEAYLHMCEFDEWENEACYHDTDVHVTCDAPFDETPSQGM